MIKFFFSILSTVLFFNGLNAQNEAPATSRITTQQLSPADAKLLKETNEVESFARNLASLKAAFANKDASRIVAYESYILQGIREQTEQATASVSTQEANTIANTRLGKMNSISAAFEQHTFDTARPEAATRDFAKLDEFLKTMQDALEDLKTGK